MAPSHTFLTDKLWYSAPAPASDTFRYRCSWTQFAIFDNFLKNFLRLVPSATPTDSMPSRKTVTLIGGWRPSCASWRATRSSGSSLDTSSKEEVEAHGLDLRHLNDELQWAFERKLVGVPEWHAYYKDRYSFLDYKVIGTRANGNLRLLPLGNGDVKDMAPYDLLISDLNHLFKPAIPSGWYPFDASMGEVVRWCIPEELKMKPSHNLGPIYGPHPVRIKDPRVDLPDKLEAVSIPAKASLLSLPNELLDMITSCLNPDDQISLKMCCRQLSQRIASPVIIKMVRSVQKIRAHPKGSCAHCRTFLHSADCKHIEDCIVEKIYAIEYHIPVPWTDIFGATRGYISRSALLDMDQEVKRLGFKQTRIFKAYLKECISPKKRWCYPIV